MANKSYSNSNSLSKRDSSSLNSNSNSSFFSGRLFYVSLALSWAAVVGLPLLYYSGVVGMVAPGTSAAAFEAAAPPGLRRRAITSWAARDSSIGLISAASSSSTSLFSAAKQATSFIRNSKQKTSGNNNFASSISSSYSSTSCFLNPGRLSKSALDTAAINCKEEQDLFYKDHKGDFYGGPGYERIMASLFSRQGNKDFFHGDTSTSSTSATTSIASSTSTTSTTSIGRPIVLVHIGAHLGGMFERYAALKRGPRLDDRLVMVEPNPANTERLFRRIRMDNRLSLIQAAISNVKGKGFFQYSGVPNTIGNGGHLVDDLEIENGNINANASIPADSPEAIGYWTDVLTLDELLDPYPHIDFLFMDPDATEPRIFLGASHTLSRIRFMIFMCAERWKEHARLITPKKTLKLLHDNGLTVVMLGKDRNLIMNDPIGPDKIIERMTTWGFCAAIRTENPPAVANLTALGLLVAGYPSNTPLKGPNSPLCARYISAAAYNNCKRNNTNGKGGGKGAVGGGGDDV
jgi:FkbM family methyltransferase